MPDIQSELRALIREQPIRFDFDRWGMFPARDVSAILGIPRRKVLLAVEQAIIQPSVPSKGRGHERKFSFLDLVRFAALQKLEPFGIAPRRMKCILQEITDSKILSLNRGDILPYIVLSYDTEEGRFVITQHFVDFPSDDDQRDLVSGATFFEWVAKDGVAVVISVRFLFETVSRKVTEFMGM